MKIKEIYKEEYKQLRTRLLDLKFKMTIELRMEDNVDYITTKDEINKIKKEIGNIIKLSQSDNKEGINK